MNRWKCIVFWVALWCLVFISAPASARHAAYRPGELLVRYKNQDQNAASRAVEQAYAIRPLKTMSHGRITHLRLPKEMSVEHALEIYRNDPDVEFAEPNYLISTQVIPNDPDFSKQWGLKNVGQLVIGYTGTNGADIDAERAWDEDEGNDTVLVAVIDTGCHVTHPDLAPNLWTNPNETAGDGIDNDGNGKVDDEQGWDFVDLDNSVQDVSGHGTHVAGIIGAVWNNGIGIAGIAPQVRIMPVRALDAFDQGTVADAIAAIQYAVTMGARIINCSWGSTSASIALRDAIAAADALFVCAAGNAETDNDVSAFYPASYALNNVISVAASDQMDRLAWFSNYGRRSVHLAAPGVRILSLGIGLETIWSDNFNSGILDGWTTGDAENSWAIRTTDPYTGRLAVTPAGDYANNSDTWAAAPQFDLSGRSGCTLTFRIIGATETNRDYLFVELSTDGVHWVNQTVKVGNGFFLTGISGAIPYWTDATVDLGPWDGDEVVRVRFRFSSDDAHTASGYFIDDMAVKAVSANEIYRYMSGTSMAAPFAAGVAALVQSNVSGLDLLGLKELLMDSVDLDSAFASTTISGGRLNAYNALRLHGDLSLWADAAGRDRVQLSWMVQAPLDDQYAIEVERRAEGETAFQQIAYVNPTVTDYIDTEVEPDTTYYYRVLAQTEDGRYGYSNQSLATTSDTSTSVSVAGGGGGGGGGGCFIGFLLK